jgi:SAM-dependent methyltransferase
MDFYLPPTEVLNNDLYNKLCSTIVDNYQFGLSIDDPGFCTRTRSINSHLDKISYAGISIPNLSSTNILEIGAGFGRVCLEFKKYFPNVNYIPLVHSKFHCGSLEVLKDVNSKFNILTPEQFNDSKVIDFLYYKITDSIPFIGTNSIDFIFSIFTYNVIPRNDLLLKDLWRILKVGGVASIPYPMEYKYIGGKYKYEFKTWAKVYDKNNNEVNYLDLLIKRGYKFCFENKNFKSAYIIKHDDSIFPDIISPIMDGDSIVGYREIA